MWLRGEWVKKVVWRVMSFVFPMLVIYLIESQVKGPKKGRDQL